MPTFEIIWLSLVQGLTEFLPISSSAHLILWPLFFGQPDQGIDFDVAVHVGTLLAVVAYFYRDLLTTTKAAVRQCMGQDYCPNTAKLFWGIMLGTIPVGLAGLFAKPYVATMLRDPMIIAYATIGFALLLWWVDRKGNPVRTLKTLRLRDILIIGVAQCLALIPGTSRSGITITAGLAVGFSRSEASRFSFLLSVPVIFLAGGLTFIDSLHGKVVTPWQDLLLGVVISAACAYACISLFMRWVDRIGMLPFVIYRLALGSFLLFGLQNAW